MKSVWQAVSLRSALAALLLAPLAALSADDSKPSGVRPNNFELPVVLANPGAEFQDDARSGAMIIGMDRTPKGRIWGCWTGTGDKPDGYLLLATSDDDGATWSKPRLAVGARTDASQLYGAHVGILWTDPKGRLWLFFNQNFGDPQGRKWPASMTNWFMRCDDPDAANPVWSTPVMFAEGCTLNKPTVLKDGAWLLPVSVWHGKTEALGSGTARVFASTDEGASWTERGSVQFPMWQFDEHMMVELNDGRLWMLARTSGQPHESFSSDGGKTWSTPQQAATVQNINARFFLRRLKSGRILLVKNGSPAERLPKRTHMSAWLSEDEGQTWKGGLLLDESNAVSYPDGFESSDGLIHILYDWNRHTDAEILLAKFREEDILAGKVISKDAKLRMLANKATGRKPEKLYNGIELPDVWPPRFRETGTRAPMPVPYLAHPPRVIPIDIGRQLFVDDFLIESTDLKRVFHQAEKFAGNPVLKAETMEEVAALRGHEATCYLGHGGVFFDPRDSVFKMFYTAGWRGGLALATSKDLLHWTRPDLGFPPGANLLLARGKEAGGDNSVWLDINAKRPEERIKFLTLYRGEGHVLKTSADGREWSQPVPTGKAGDYCSFFFNPFRNVWVFSIKADDSRERRRYYSESRDFLQGADWSKAVYWSNADHLDKPEPAGGYPGAGEPAQLYSLSAVAYESVMLGVHMIWRGPHNEICDKEKFPKLSDLSLGFSRDGFHWHRPDRRPFIAASRAEGTWDRAYVHTTAGVCLVMDDKLWFPYVAFSGIAPSGKRGMYTGGAIGMASLRRDGFASLEGPGSVTTRSVKFNGQHLFVNLNGDLRVEVLDEAGKLLATSKTVSGDNTKQRVELSGLAALAGKPVKFRFHVARGALYAFWVTPDEKGASYGYVGAGGPAFGGVRDVPTPE